MPRQPPSARRHYRWSAALATRAVREAAKARPSGTAAVATVVAVHQATAAAQATPAIAQMLTEQAIDVAADALLNSAAFVSSIQTMTAALDKVDLDWEFNRLVASLVQESGRAAEQVAVTTRRDVGYVRHLSPPSCSRCAVLAGRIYRYSTGFKRHPGCDCVMVPTTLSSPDMTYDPLELMRAGQVTNLSKADRQAIEDGADFGRVVNVRLQKAGLTSSGRVLARRGKPTPEAIYAATNNRDDAIQGLIAAGYIRT